MDPWINSLVQSPLVRSLNTVPSRMSSFAHGVKDNVPPFSSTKVTLDPFQPSSAGWQASALTAPSDNSTSLFTFQIPQYGLLDKMYLKVRVFRKYAADLYNDTNPDAATLNDGLRTPLNSPAIRAFAASDPATAAGMFGQTSSYYDAKRQSVSTSMNFANVFTEIRLKTNNKDIERLYPAAIANEVSKLPSNLRSFYEEALCGYAAGLVLNANGTAPTSFPAQFTHLWDPSADIVTVTHDGIVADYKWGASHKAGGDSIVNAVRGAHYFVDFLIPLPFSSLHQLKDNFQTRFVEPLEVHVQAQAFPGIHTGRSGSTDNGSDGYRMSLVCTFHNFHDVIENSIRDQNYKRGFPASIYAYDHQSSAALTSTTNTGNEIKIFLNSKNLVSEIILLRKNTATIASQFAPNAAGGALIGRLPYSTMFNESSDSNRPYYIKFEGSGRIIWEGWDYELLGPDASDYELADGHPYGEDSVQSGRKNRYLPASQSNTVSKFNDYIVTTAPANAQANEICVTNTFLVGGVQLGFAHSMRVMKFGFQSNCHYYTGAIALQTISNPTITISDPSQSAMFTNQSFDCVLKCCTMNRIDSDTGVVTTTLNV